MKTPFVLVEDHLSHDTVACLQALLEHAQKGDLIGIAYAAMFKRRGYAVDAAGEAHRSPTYSRGMLRALDDKLGRRVSG